MLGITPTHLSTCQELRDCELPSCQTSSDGWVSLTSRGSKAQEENERDRRREKSVNVNIEKEDFQAHTKLGLKFILKQDINIKQDIEVFLVKY